MVLFQETNTPGARKTISRIIGDSYPDKMPLTLSFGLVNLGISRDEPPKDSSPRDVLANMLNSADKLMYRAKEQKGTPENPRSVLAYNSPSEGNLVFEHF